MTQLFVRNGRLRSGWRIFTYMLVSRIAILAFSFLVILGVGLYLLPQGNSADGLTSRITELTRSVPFLAAIEIIQFAILVLCVLLWRWLFDRLSFRSLGVAVEPESVRHFLVGAGLIGLTWLVIFGASVTTSTVAIQGIRLDPFAILAGLALGLFYNLLVGFSEELDARGYILQNLEQGVGFWAAVLMSALIFGAQHLVNPGANAGTIVGTMLFGVLAALAYRSTGDLWMPIGMHAAWNFFEGPVFGFLVSGIDLGGLFQIQPLGPEWLTGGSFGPEAGALTWIPILVLIGIFYLKGPAKRTCEQGTRSLGSR